MAASIAFFHPYSLITNNNNYQSHQIRNNIGLATIFGTNTKLIFPLLTQFPQLKITVYWTYSSIVTLKLRIISGLITVLSADQSILAPWELQKTELIIPGLTVDTPYNFELDANGSQCHVLGVLVEEEP